MGAACSSCQSQEQQQEIDTKNGQTSKSRIPTLSSFTRQQDEDLMKRIEQSSKKKSFPNHDPELKTKKTDSDHQISIHCHLQSRDIESQMMEDQCEVQYTEESEVIRKQYNHAVSEHISQPRLSTSSDSSDSAELIPDYFNSITRQKLKDLNPFEYNKPQFEVSGALPKPPLLSENQNIYEGQWKEERRNGKGKQTWKNGAFYQGYWKENKIHGYGRFIHQNGDVYEGSWLYGRAEGYGVYSQASGLIYEGNWKNDKKDGYGEEKQSNGTFFKGYYRDGMKHGKGRFEWPDSSWYEGQFADNNINGIGYYQWKDGNTYEGTWRNNTMDGKGIYKWADGRMYEGEYKNDKKHGLGILRWPGGKTHKGQWVDGIQTIVSQTNRKGVLRPKLNKSSKDHSHKVKFAANPI